MEAASKKKRGRPRTIPEGMFPKGLLTAGTERGRQNYVYALDGMAAIGCAAGPKQSDGRLATTAFPLLVDWNAAEESRRGAVKFGVLAEIGRASREFSPDVVMLMATRIHEALLDGSLNTAREAETQVRAWRVSMKAAYSDANTAPSSS